MGVIYRAPTLSQSGRLLFTFRARRKDQHHANYDSHDFLNKDRVDGDKYGSQNKATCEYAFDRCHRARFPEDGVGLKA